MASGLPDYKIGVRLAYGQARQKAGGLIVKASDITEILSVTGKGVIYGGAVIVDYTASQNGSFVMLEVDDVQLSSANFFTLEAYGLDKQYCFPFYLMKYDDVNFVYTVGVMEGITFESGLRYLYEEINGDTPTVTGFLIYALM